LPIKLNKSSWCNFAYKMSGTCIVQVQLVYDHDGNARKLKVKNKNKKYKYDD